MIAAGRPATEEPEIGRLRARDHGAFALLMDWHYTPVRRYLARLTGNGEVAMDLAQETFLRAYLALPRLEEDSDLGAWLFRIATNLARQHHRRGKILGFTPLGEDESPVRGSRFNVQGHGGTTFEDAVAREELVRRALAQLPLEYRACLLLYAWAGYTCAEIGEMVGKSADAVRMILVRARRRFRDAYEDSDDMRCLRDTGSSGTGMPGGTRQAPARMTEDGRREHDAECSDVEEALTFFPRGDLRREEFTSVTRHLAACAGCRRSLTDVQALYRVLQAHLFSVAGGEPGPAAGAPVHVRARQALLAMAAELPVDAEPVLVPVSLTPVRVHPLG